VNNYGFEVQRSIKDDGWEQIVFVDGFGNSNSPKDYSIIDSQLSESGEYQYRLKQIDNDGSFDYSQVISVNVGIPDSYSLSQNYPNPFNPVTRIDFALPEKQKVVLRIYNMLGELVREVINNEKEAGHYSIKVNSVGFASGVYIYRLETSAYVASRKMMLLK
jgi:hypothetical protein